MDNKDIIGLSMGYLGVIVMNLIFIVGMTFKIDIYNPTLSICFLMWAMIVYVRFNKYNKNVKINN